jgi:hypothetical protein
MPEAVMTNQPALPDTGEMWRAIETYLSLAYDGDPPSMVATRLSSLKNAGERLFEDGAVEHPGADGDGAAHRLAVRLGNRFYPHMKLMLSPSPDGRGYLFGVDSHDAHCCPPAESPEHAMFCELMGKNRQIGTAIEAAWETQGILTFKAYLRQDLANRRASQPSIPVAR